jgi:hypothetical protein
MLIATDYPFLDVLWYPAGSPPAGCSERWRRVLGPVVLAKRATLAVISPLAHLAVDLVADPLPASTGASSPKRSAIRRARSNTTQAMTLEYV